MFTYNCTNMQYCRKPAPVKGFRHGLRHAYQQPAVHIGQFGHISHSSCCLESYRKIKLTKHSRAKHKHLYRAKKMLFSEAKCTSTHNATALGLTRAFRFSTNALCSSGFLRGAVSWALSKCAALQAKEHSTRYRHRFAMLIS